MGWRETIFGSVKKILENIGHPRRQVYTLISFVGESICYELDFDGKNEDDIFRWTGEGWLGSCSEKEFVDVEQGLVVVQIAVGEQVPFGEGGRVGEVVAGGSVSIGVLQVVRRIHCAAGLGVGGGVEVDVVAEYSAPVVHRWVRRNFRYPALRLAHEVADDVVAELDVVLVDLLLVGARGVVVEGVVVVGGLVGGRALGGGGVGGVGGSGWTPEIGRRHGVRGEAEGKEWMTS